MQLVAMVIVTSLMIWIFQPRFHERWVVNVFLCKTMLGQRLWLLYLMSLHLSWCLVPNVGNPCIVFSTGCDEFTPR